MVLYSYNNRPLPNNIMQTSWMPTSPYLYCQTCSCLQLFATTTKIAAIVSVFWIVRKNVKLWNIFDANTHIHLMFRDQCSFGTEYYCDSRKRASGWRLNVWKILIASEKPWMKQQCSEWVRTWRHSFTFLFYLALGVRVVHMHAAADNRSTRSLTLLHALFMLWNVKTIKKKQDCRKEVQSM